MKQTATILQEISLLPALRSTLYSLLAAAFRYPSEEAFENVENGTYAAALRDIMARLPHLAGLTPPGPTVPLLPGLGDCSYEEFQTQFVAAFEVGSPEPPCPPYEGEYRKGQERTALMLQLSAFYRHFGLAMSTEQEHRELPDHISTELEFMHFLGFKEAQARSAGQEELLDGYLLAQSDFLQHQLSQWLPSLAERLEKHCPSPFYAALGTLTARIVAADLQGISERLPQTARIG